MDNQREPVAADFRAADKYNTMLISYARSNNITLDEVNFCLVCSPSVAKEVRMLNDLGLLIKIPKLHIVHTLKDGEAYFTTFNYEKKQK